MPVQGRWGISPTVGQPEGEVCLGSWLGCLALPPRATRNGARGLCVPTLVRFAGRRLRGSRQWAAGGCVGCPRGDLLGRTQRMRRGTADGASAERTTRWLLCPEAPAGRRSVRPFAAQRDSRREPTCDGQMQQRGRVSKFERVCVCGCGCCF